MTSGLILVIEDKRNMLRLLERVLGEHHEVLTAETGEEGLAIFEREAVDLVLSDIKLPDLDGLALLEAMKQRKPEVEVLLMTAYGSVASAVDAMKKGALDYITKPFEPDEIVLVVQRAMERMALQSKAHHLQREVESLYGFANIVGTSPAMQEVYALMRKVVNSDTTVLITGDSGTGKELVARAIHYTSNRRTRRFVPVNCGAIPKDLLESEMFGHEKGAFSGAHRTKRGLIEEADGGTLLLDEISELPLDLQVKINRVLQDKQVRRVGARADRPVDVRFLTATNRDLQERVSQGLFREDLFYRINVYPIPIPPLRARAEDIPLLINHFVAKYNKTKDEGTSAIDSEAIQALQTYSWPGNVRELENAIERATLLAEEGPIKLEHLPPSILERSHRPSGEALVSLPYHEAVQAAAHDFSKAYLVAVLKRHQGNVTRAAKDTGIERESFHRLLKKHDVKAKEFRNS